VSAVAYIWLLDCLRHHDAPDHAIEIMAACAQVLGADDDTLRALVEANPELDWAYYHERYDAGTLLVDWRLVSQDQHPAPAPDAPVRAFGTWLDQTGMGDAWGHGVNSAQESLGGRLGIHRGNFAAHLDDLACTTGDAIVGAGLRTLDDLTEEILTAIGCPPDRFSRFAVVSLAGAWDGTIYELVDSAPRVFTNPAGNPVDDRPADGLYWVDVWKTVNPWHGKVF
jgi:hypothetical protein